MRRSLFRWWEWVVIVVAGIAILAGSIVLWRLFIRWAVS